MLNHGPKLAALLALLGLLNPGPLIASDLVLAQASADSGEIGKPKLVDLWQPGDAGQRINIRGRVTSLDGTPLSGIAINIRQADGEGDYRQQYSTILLSDDKGRFQFGSVVPGNYSGAKHIHVSVYVENFEYFDSSILFKGDPNLDQHYENGKAVFLEESTVNDETIMFGRFDIMLTPQ